MGYDVIVTFSNFHQTIVHTSKSIEATKFILGTNIQQQKVLLLMIKVKVTLTDDEGLS